MELDVIERNFWKVWFTLYVFPLFRKFISQTEPLNRKMLLTSRLEISQISKENFLIFSNANPHVSTPIYKHRTG